MRTMTRAELGENLAYSTESLMLHKERIFAKSGRPGTFDTATPQAWFDQMLALGADPHGYVWWYPPRDHPEYSLCGKPLSVLVLIAEAVKLGHFVSYEVALQMIAMSKEDRISFADE